MLLPARSWKRFSKAIAIERHNSDNGVKFIDRMDRNNVESHHGMHEDQSWL
jgi:hypothetical protein